MPRRSPLRAAVLAAALAAAAAAAACSSGDDDGQVERSDDGVTSSPTTASDATSSPSEPARRDVDPSRAEVVRLAIPGVRSLDPVAASPASVSELVLADLLYDTLTEIDDDGLPVPGLATFAANADRTVWRFTLTGEPTFADGTPISAEDVVYSLQRIVDQGESSLAGLRLDGVTSIAAAGPGLIDITLDAPSSVLPELLASPAYAVTDAETMTPFLAGGDQTPNTSGDHAASIEEGRSLVLERRRGSGPARVEIDLVESVDAALDAFLAGDVDWAIVPPDRLGEALEIGDVADLSEFQATLLLGLDAGVAPLGRPGLRKAIALAIDRTALADAVFGATAASLRGVVPDGVPGAANECRSPCGRQRDEARALVSQEFPDGQVPTLRLLVDDSPAQTGAAGVIAEQLGDVGIPVEVTSLEARPYQQLIAGGQQQLFLFGWLGVVRSPASFLPSLLASASPDNVTGFSDPGVDDLLARAQREPVPAVRARLWREVEARALEQVPIVPLVQFRTVAVSRPGVQGIEVAVDGSIDLSGVTVEPSE